MGFTPKSDSRGDEARIEVMSGAVHTMNATLLTYDSPMAVFSATKYSEPPTSPKIRNSNSSRQESLQSRRGEMVQMQR